MIMAKSLEKSVENFVASITKAIQSYKKDLIKRKNMKEKYAIEQAIKYGIKTLHSGLGDTVTAEKAEELFREQAIISKVLADYCKEIAEK